jgi:perosamine synthetase
MKPVVVFDAPNIGAEEKKALIDSIESGYVSTAGPAVAKFEEAFARYIQAPRVSAVQSGTAALHMALYELGIGAGDDVIVPVSSFIATVNPVLYVGARPVFVDIDAQTWNIDCAKIELAITEKTKAIIVVHLYGCPCDMELILKIAKKYNLYVIEDATESLGALYDSQMTGTWGDVGCFSFNGNKIMTTGSGGMFVARDGQKVEHVKFLVNQAKDKSNSMYHPEMGFNYRMTNIEASLGLAQLQKLPFFLKQKRRFNQIYREELSGLPGISFQETRANTESSWWLTAVMLPENIDLLEFQRLLMEQGVPTRRHFMPLVEFPPYQRFKNADYPQAYKTYARGLCLPGSTLNNEETIQYVSRVFKNIYKELDQKSKVSVNGRSS